MDQTHDALDLINEYAREGRDVQLYGVNGQYVFPRYSESGSLRSVSSIFPILRGSGARAPKFDGDFPTIDGTTIDLGDGWVVMCIDIAMHDGLQTIRAKLAAGEAKLRAMKVPA